MMAPVKRSRVIPALALTAALTLAGCSVGDSTEGVSVDGQTYSMAELHEATEQLNQLGQQTDAKQVIADLALLPLLEQVFQGSPGVVTDAQVRDVFGQGGVSDPGQASLDAGRSRQYQQQLGDPAILQDPAMQEVLVRAQSVTNDDLAAIDVDVNPRYGTWDVANGGLVPGTPAWIQSSSDS